MNQEKIKKLERTVSSDYSNTAGIVVQKDGINVYERYFNGCTAQDAIHVYSVTKSVFSALMGIAIHKGFIKSVDQKVLAFFPDYRIRPGEKTIQDITIKHLLTMTAPYTFETEPYEAFFGSDNWVNAALNYLGGEKSTGEFRYSPIIGAHILSGILVNATGQPVLNFARENLFMPLGIHIPDNIVFRNEEEQMAFYEKEKHSRGWVADPQGINTASWGLTLTPGDMAKIGQLYLNNGLWEGRQIIPVQWTEVSTREHVRWGELSYGYLWWVIDGEEGIFAAMGDGGNVIYVNRKKKMVVAVASFFRPETRDRIDFIKEQIEPMLE